MAEWRAEVSVVGRTEERDAMLAVGSTGRGGGGRREGKGEEKGTYDDASHRGGEYDQSCHWRIRDSSIEPCWREKGGSIELRKLRKVVKRSDGIA